VLINNPIGLTNLPLSLSEYTCGPGIIFNSINYVNITIDNFSEPYNNGYYKADVTIHVVDAFGLDNSKHDPSYRHNDMGDLMA